MVNRLLLCRKAEAQVGSPRAHMHSLVSYRYVADNSINTLTDDLMKDKMELGERPHMIVGVDLGMTCKSLHVSCTASFVLASLSLARFAFHMQPWTASKYLADSSTPLRYRSCVCQPLDRQ